jgi:hypothetical protein
MPAGESSEILLPAPFVNIKPDLFFDQVIQAVFIVRDPVRKMGFNDLPVGIGFLHMEHNAIATVVGYIHMKKVVGITGKPPEIEFAQAVKCFDELGEMYVFGKSEIHSVQFKYERARSVLYLINEMLIH